jgi:LemA protein
MLLWIGIGIAAILIIMFIYYFNRLVTLKNQIDNALSQIDVQLKKRSDLVPNLLESVKGYMKHERAVITEVTNARKALVGAGDISGKMKAGSKLASALRSVFAIAENYPQLKASENFAKLQDELANIEERIAYSRQFYNDATLSYNNACTTFPGAMFAKMYGKQAQEFIKIPEEERVAPKVKF